MSKKKKVSSVKVKGSSNKIKKSAEPVSKSKPTKKVISKKVVAKKAAPKAKKVVKPIKKNVIAPKSPVTKKVVATKGSPLTKKAIKPAKVVVKKEVKKVELKKLIEKKVIPAKIIEEKVAPVKSGKKEVAEDNDKKNEVLAIMNTIPKAKVSVLSASKIASITSSITNPIKKQGAYAVKVEKEPNGKFEIEFGFRASGEMLYEFFSTASGLSEWFCDDVNIRNGIYTFIWDGQMQQARLLKTVDNHLARYQWVDKTDGSYFEFRVQRDDLTNDMSLVVTDFAETKSDQESAKLLWHSQVEKLMHVIGSIF